MAMNDIEELFLDDGIEFEEIEKYSSRYRLPVVVVRDSIIYFNAKAAKYVPANLKFFATSEYFICLPTTPNATNGFKTFAVKGGGLQMHTPTALKEKSIKPGVYNIYKYKDGFAFKRYEPLAN